MLIMIEEDLVLHESVLTKLEADVGEVVFAYLLSTDPVEITELGFQWQCGAAQLSSH